MQTIKSLLMLIEEKCKTEFTAPAEDNLIEKLNILIKHKAEDLNELYRISNGFKINIPGTEIYSIERIIKLNEAHPLSKEGVIIGCFNFGDVIAVSDDGTIVQLNHESEDVFLKWDSILDFLIDELAALE